MYFHFTNAQLISAVVVLIFLVLVALVGFVHQRGIRTLALRTRFRSEGGRAVPEHGSSRRTEANPADRESRVHLPRIRELGVSAREQFIAGWQTVQSSFLDHPTAVVTPAGNLIDVLRESSGYPKNSLEQRAADISVTYRRVMEHYRAVHAIAVRPGGAEASDEQLRTALIQYRAIFDDVVQAQKPQHKRAAA
jgi:hypothetical protein